jgi:hypothetical protein
MRFIQDVAKTVNTAVNTQVVNPSIPASATRPTGLNSGDSPDLAGSDSAARVDSCQEFQNQTTAQITRSASEAAASIETTSA